MRTERSDWARRLNLTAEQEIELEQLARRLDRSIAWLIRHALLSFIETEGRTDGRI